MWVVDSLAHREGNPEQHNKRACHPGCVAVLSDPLGSLATALAADAMIGPRIGDVGDLIKRLEAEETRLHLTTRVALGNGPESQRVVVVIDQFEELFTLNSDNSAKARATLEPAESQAGELRRKSFIDNLVFAAGVPGGKTIVILTMRAEVLLKVMHQTTHHGKLRLLSESLALFPALLTSDDLAQATAKLLSQIQPSSLPPELREAAKGLAALPISLSPAESLPAVSVLIDRLEMSTNPETHRQLDTALQFLAGKMASTAATEAAKPILEAMARSDATEKILVLANGLRGMESDGKTLWAIRQFAEL